MIDLNALSAAGLTNKVLKDIFTAKAPEGVTVSRTKKKKGAEPTDNPNDALAQLESLPDNPTKWDVRRFWERRISARAIDGMNRCAANFNAFAGIDLAYSAGVPNPVMLPVMRVAQGFIDMESCASQISGLSETWKNTMFERDAQGKIASIKGEELVKTSHNLVNSLVTRRVAALSTEVYQQFPLYHYDPFSNKQTEKFRGDVNTQLSEQIAGSYGYRHDYEESIRQSSLYGYSIKFKSNAWHTEHQTLPKQTEANGASNSGRETKPKLERQIVKEGVLFTTPHPSRVYTDISQPVSRMNYDIGPQYGGHWNVVRVGDIRSNPDYFNKDSIYMDSSVENFFQAQTGYFSQYYPETMIAPRPSIGPAASMALNNDRVANIGVVATLKNDAPTTITEHYEYVIPKDVGFGTYQDPVWIRFSVAGNRTVVYAEIVGSAPWSMNAYNTSDGLLLSPSFAMQVLPYQQEISNLLSQLLKVQYQSMVRIWALNKQGMSKEDVEKVVHALQYPDYTSAKDIIIEYDALALADRGQDISTIKDKLTQIKVDTREEVTAIFSSIIQLLAIAERLLFFSPQELGQVSPRTITAYEAKMVSTTTLGIRDFHLIGVKQQMDADKRIIHDSYMAFGSDDLEVPVAERYTKETVEAAGFEIVDDGTDNPSGLFTVKGKKLGLLYNYVFTTRNTDDVPAEAVEAQALVQLLDVISKDQVLAQYFPAAKRIDLINRIATRISGSDFKLSVEDAGGAAAPGAAGAAPGQPGAADTAQAIPLLMQALQAMQKQQAQDRAGLVELANAVTALASKLQATPPRIRQQPTRRGQISPEFPVGSGAPAPQVRQAQPVRLAV